MVLDKSVPPVESSFALEISSQGVPASLLTELATIVGRQVGCVVPVGEMQRALESATVTGSTFGGARRCDVQIRTRGRSLEILVSAGGGRVWQTACAIP